MKNSLFHDVRAASLVGGASDFIADERGNVAIGQHTPHTAATQVLPGIWFTDTSRTDGGDVAAALDDIEVWVYTPEGIPVMDVEATLAMRADLNAPRPTWLERIARRFPPR